MLKSDGRNKLLLSHFLSFTHSSVKLYASPEGINNKELKCKIEVRAFNNENPVKGLYSSY